MSVDENKIPDSFHLDSQGEEWGDYLEDLDENLSQVEMLSITFL